MSQAQAVKTTPLSNGLKRSAALMRALGSHGQTIWATLSPAEANQLSTAMEALEPSAEFESDSAQAFIQDMQTEANLPNASIWKDLSGLDGAHLAQLLSAESPQIIALILSRIRPNSAAAAIRALPRSIATETLRRMLNLGQVNAAAFSVIEDQLGQTLHAEQRLNGGAGHQRVARIFDNLSDQIEKGLLSELDQAEPGSGQRIRALMFTFDDLATLGPASLQTLLSHIDRCALIKAMKGAKPETAEAFLNNMTARARELLLSEIEALGPLRRADIEAARLEITDLARTLAARGDILAKHADEDELVE